MKRLILAATGIGLLVGISIIAGSQLLPNLKAKPAASPIGPTKTFTDSKLGLELKYPEQLKPEPLTEQDAKDRINFRLSSAKPAFLIAGRSETGLRVVVNATKIPMIDGLLRSLERSYPARFPDFKQDETRRLTVSGRNAAEVTFSYKGPSGERAAQRLLIVALDDDTAYYLSGQVKAAELDKANSVLFDQVFGSLTIE
jgi:hypothetical protein